MADKKNQSKTGSSVVYGRDLEKMTKHMNACVANFIEDGLSWQSDLLPTIHNKHNFNGDIDT